MNASGFRVQPVQVNPPALRARAIASAEEWSTCPPARFPGGLGDVESPSPPEHPATRARAVRAMAARLMDARLSECFGDLLAVDAASFAAGAGGQRLVDEGP